MSCTLAIGLVTFGHGKNQNDGGNRTEPVLLRCPAKDLHQWHKICRATGDSTLAVGDITPRFSNKTILKFLLNTTLLYLIRNVISGKGSQAQTHYR